VAKARLVGLMAVPFAIRLGRDMHVGHENILFAVRRNRNAIFGQNTHFIDRFLQVALFGISSLSSIAH
jgi:hypothetical protein